jgi:hypothetical protein
MATRVSGDLGLTGQPLIRRLRKEAPGKSGRARFIGLKRSSALSDVEDRGESLNNILRKVSITESAETNQYGGPYDALDWNVTSDFVDEGIDRSFLSRLAGASIGGGSLGSTVSITPRIRIQDRINFLDSFYGNGTYPGLHSGPSAQFYRPPVTPQHIGFIKFSFNSGTGAVTVSELKDTDEVTNLSESTILGTESAVILDLDQYETADGLTINLSGLGISLRLTSSPTAWTVEGASAISKLSGIQSATGNFSNLVFKLIRPYSVRNKPLWFTQSPNDADTTLSDGNLDDNNQSTSSKVLVNSSGNILPYIEKGYWFTRAWIGSRWTGPEQTLLTADSSGGDDSIIVEDSNFRWQQPPSPLRAYQYNWGIRWDGYLRVTPGIYAFEVQTNVQVKIDMAIASDATSWVEVFSVDGNSAQQSEQTYLSKVTFNTDQLSDQYKYGYSDNWVAYVPITIRMYHGATDSIALDEIVPTEPNLFIKTTSVSSTTKFYSEEHVIDIDGSAVTGSTLDQVIDILEDADASVSYSLVASSDDILASPISIALATDGTNVTTATSVDVGTYTLRISPLRTSEFNDNLTALWKGRIASPDEAYVSYSDLTDGSYEPNIQKVGFDTRPTWWKVSEGHPYDTDPNAVDGDNTPLDGFLENSFNSSLRSPALGQGLYGDGGTSLTGTVGISGDTMTGTSTAFTSELGVGDVVDVAAGEKYIIEEVVSDTSAKVSPNNRVVIPGSAIEKHTYPSRPNIILGEARYSDSEELGSNYIGLRMVPNQLGEAGKLSFNAVPINSAMYEDGDLLGANDLGGETAASGKVSPNSIRLYLSNVTDTADPRYNKFYTVNMYDELAVLPGTGSTGVVYYAVAEDKYYSWNGSAYVEIASPSSDDPTGYGLPSFSNGAWLSPINVSVTRVADDSGFTTNVNPLKALLVVTVERYEDDTNSVDLIQISTTQGTLQVGGSDISSFSGKYIEYYTEENATYNYLRVDSGESMAFADVLKITYDGSTLNGGFSEIPRPASARVTPFGFDPESSAEICYPPYAISDPLLSAIAVSDTDLYDAGNTKGQYDVFWGNPTKSELGGKTLTVTEKLEFKESNGSAVESLGDDGLDLGVQIAFADYTHRLKIDLPVDASGYDEDQLIHIGNQEEVKDSYYAYVKLDS